MSQKTQRSFCAYHSRAARNSYLSLRGTNVVAVTCECAWLHSSPESGPKFLYTATYLNRASRFRSVMRTVCPRLLAALFHRVALGFCNLLRLQSAQFAPCTQL